MTARRRNDETSTTTTGETATTREAKGSVHEAIGKLIGDDAARARGAAEKNAGAADASATRKSSRP